MTLSRKLSDALNEQIQAEMWSSNLYLSMYIHFAQIGFGRLRPLDEKTIGRRTRSCL